MHYTVTDEDFNTHLPITDITSRQKIRKDIKNVNNINQLD